MLLRPIVSKKRRILQDLFSANDKSRYRRSKLLLLSLRYILKLRINPFVGGVIFGKVGVKEIFTGVFLKKRQKNWFLFTFQLK